MIRTELLTRRFDDILAVDRLNLEVAQGEVLGFLGPNGAGKTTTVRMLAALIQPTAGSASVAGCDVVADPMGVRRKVGLLTETPGMYERLSARRNLEIFAALYDVEAPDRQVQKYLSLLGLWDRRDDPAGSFSKGMRQKLAICRALLHEPPVLFLDEPTSALDPEASRTVRNFLQQLKDQGRTIFLCTHNLDEADRLCDRVAVFKSRLLVVDTADNLRAAAYGREVSIQIDGGSDAHRDALRALPFQPEVTRQGDTLVVRTNDPEQHNPAMIRALVGAGANVQYITEVQHSLEAVYLDLLADERQQS